MTIHQMTTKHDICISTIFHQMKKLRHLHVHDLASDEIIINLLTCADDVTSLEEDAKSSVDVTNKFADVKEKITSLAEGVTADLSVGLPQTGGSRGRASTHPLIMSSHYEYYEFSQ